MTLRSRVERIESGIDIAALTPEQVARLDVTMLTKAQKQALNVLHLTEGQLALLDLDELTDLQLDQIIDAMRPEEIAWLQSLTTEELRGVISGDIPIPSALLCAEA